MDYLMSLSQLWPLSQDAQDIATLESWAYHQTLIGEHPEPCSMCHNRLSEAEIIKSNLHFSARHATQNSKPQSRTGFLSWLMAKLFKK